MTPYNGALDADGVPTEAPDEGKAWTDSNKGVRTDAVAKGMDEAMALEYIPPKWIQRKKGAGTAANIGAVMNALHTIRGRVDEETMTKIVKGVAKDPLFNEVDGSTLAYEHTRDYFNLNTGITQNVMTWRMSDGSGVTPDQILMALDTKA